MFVCVKKASWLKGLASKKISCLLILASCQKVKFEPYDLDLKVTEEYPMTLTSRLLRSEAIKKTLHQYLNQSKYQLNPSKRFTDGDGEL